MQLLANLQIDLLLTNRCEFRNAFCCEPALFFGRINVSPQTEHPLMLVIKKEGRRPVRRPESIIFSEDPQQMFANPPKFDAMPGSSQQIHKFCHLIFQLAARQLNKLIIAIQQMIKNNQGHGHSRQTADPPHVPKVHFYHQSLTEPLQISADGGLQHGRLHRKQRKSLQTGKNRESHEIYIKIVDEQALGSPAKQRHRHKKGKSMDLEIVSERTDSGGNQLPHKQPDRSKKIVINSNFIHEMRRRSTNSEMKHYSLPFKSNRPIEERAEGKKTKKKKSFEHLQSGKRTEKIIIEINTNHTAPSHLKKKHSKPLMQQSLTLSTKLYKPEQRSVQLAQDRRCKSSLKQKKNSKNLGDLKAIGKTLPLPSKLNSLYSNTTSVYNSHNDLALIQKKLSLRIPTEENEQISQIRKYESMVLSNDKSIKVLRNSRQQNFTKADRPVQLESIKTEDIINSYLLKFEAESQPEIVQPPTLEKINEIYNQTSLKLMGRRSNQAENSLIERLDSVSIDEHFKEEGESTKLNQIITIIQRGGKNIVQDSKDKEYIIKTIKEILQNKKNQSEKSEILTIQKYEPKEVKTKTFLDSNSINTSSLSSSMASEADISVLNLEILDKALRQRQEYLQNRLKKEIQRIQQDQSDIQERGDQIERVRKWITHQINQVHHTRTQLWKGFNVAKNLLKDELSDKSKEMMRCLSEKYIHRNTHISKYRKQAIKQPNDAEDSAEQKREEWSQLNNAMVQQFDAKRQEDEEVASPIVLSQLIETNPLHLQDLRFLRSNDSNQGESHGESAIQYDSPQSLKMQLKRIQQQSSEKIEKALRRQRLNCESPQSDSENESYDAVIIERSDTFLFSSQKKYSSPYFNISTEDKQDICEFIFLDLCIEISDEQGEGSKVIQALSKFIRKMKQQSKRQKGFKTNSNAIKEYLTNFINFLKNKPEIIEEIHLALDKPMGPTTLEILRYMHNYNDQVDEENETYVLTAKIFDCFEDTYMRGIKLERYYEDEERESKRRLFIKNAIHIHNKAIYDAYNEALDKDRPFGIWGQPFKWKKTARFSHFRDTRSKNDILLKRAQQTIEFSSYMCGFMVDKQDCPLKDHPNVTDAYIQQIRHDRLSNMMARELEQSEERMRFFDDEETELLVDMAQSIFMTLLTELSEDLRLLL